MGLRQVNLEAPKFDTDKKIIHINEHDSISAVKQNWESIDCCLVTPLHGGGVKARESDKDMPIRVTEIRGQLRFWWRLLAKYKWKIEDSKLRKQEFALWGGMSDGEEDGKASLVFLRVCSKQRLKLVPITKYYDTLDYALFTARATGDGLPEMKLGNEGFEWHLEYAFDNKITDEQKQQFYETLRWFVTLGGFGGRTRRGCGAFSADGVKLVSEQEMEKLGCQILFASTELYDNPIIAWRDVIAKWKDMRQVQYKYSIQSSKVSNHRHFSNILSKPVRVIDNQENSKKWKGMIIILPNCIREIRDIFLGKNDD